MKNIILILGGILIFLNFSIVIGGIIDASLRDENIDAYDFYNHNYCKWPTTRISYIFPSYALGCWLGSKP